MMTDVNIKNKHHILEAIDQLRRRKARPDIDRICNFVTKRFSVDSRDTKADLQRCVENAIVFKVEYKGSISYRNAAKKTYGHTRKDTLTMAGRSLAIALATNSSSSINLLQTPPQSISINNPVHSFAHSFDKAEQNKLFANILTTVVAELCLDDSDYLDYGVPCGELVKKILTKHSSKFNRKIIIDLIQREVINGGLIKMANGNYSLGPSSSQSDRTSESENVGSIDNSMHSNPVNTVLEQIDDDDDYLTMNTSCDVTPPIKIRKKPGPKPGKRKNDMEKLRNMEECSGAGIRMGGRRKKGKKIFDPSDNNLPKANRKRGRPLGSLNKSTIEKQTALLNARSHNSNNASSFSGSPHHTSESPSSRPTSRASSIGAMGGNSSCGSIGGRDHGGVCSVCHIQGKKGPHDKMISCRECSNKAHISCLNTNDGMLKMYPDNTWQCPHCKTCVVCYETSNAGILTVCIICADAYHSFCHEPKIQEKIKEAFKCCNCQMEPLLADIKPKLEKREKNEDLSGAEHSSPSSPHSGHSSPYLVSPGNSPTPPRLSPQSNHNQQNGISTLNNNGVGGGRSASSSEYKFYNTNMSDSQSVKDYDVEETFDPNIPDASNWSFDEVYNYFVQYFPEEAIVFKEQEIDGHSLLLMKRVDVLTSLNLKLGPALKIYRHVLKLQVRRDDSKLYWL